MEQSSHEFNKLKEDMDWINFMIQKETPCKNYQDSSFHQMDSSRMLSETVGMSSEAATPHIASSPLKYGVNESHANL